MASSFEEPHSEPQTIDPHSTQSSLPDLYYADPAVGEAQHAHSDGDGATVEVGTTTETPAHESDESNVSDSNGATEHTDSGPAATETTSTETHLSDQNAPEAVARNDPSPNHTDVQTPNEEKGASHLETVPQQPEQASGLHSEDSNRQPSLEQNSVDPQSSGPSESSNVIDHLIDFAREVISFFAGPEYLSKGANHDNAVADLSHVAQHALNQFPNACNLSVAAVAHHFGITDLDGRTANSQVHFMESHWVPVSATEASASANSGRFVVAGWANPDASQHGHTAVVTPGPGGFDRHGTFSPNVTGGGTGLGQGNGRTTAIDVFSAKRDFHYYEPRL